MRFTAEAPAKINLYLSVGERRADGYHDVDTVLVALDLCDDVAVETAAALRVTTSPDLGIAPEQDLAWKAATSLGREVGIEPRVRITVEKRIPVGAGLGGGSSDAAAVLACLARLWDIAPDDPAIDRVAAQCGADVGFCLRGGAALYGGRGDRLIRTLPDLDAVMVLVNPGRPVSTAAAYAAFDAIPRADAPGPSRLEAALRGNDLTGTGALLFNSLTEASVGLVPEIGDALALVREAPGCLGAAMAGSGSTAFGVFTDEGPARDAAGAARDRGWWSRVVRPRRGGAMDTLRTGDGP